MLQLFFAVAFSAVPLTLYLPPIRSLNLFVVTLEEFLRQTALGAYPRVRHACVRLFNSLVRLARVDGYMKIYRECVDGRAVSNPKLDLGEVQRRKASISVGKGPEPTLVVYGLTGPNSSLGSPDNRSTVLGGSPTIDGPGQTPVFDHVLPHPPSILITS
ncbi:hypothetical protein SAY86_005803 [Trapa natans]|uniref:Uncharacterized protein n=1 Tax=Trapa natans TaxID=22666 RepID=A0AAN7L8P0_TRANT|nr:hypothetical protein SAY86_005803 [Trapa natans]